MGLDGESERGYEKQKVRRKTDRAGVKPEIHLILSLESRCDHPGDYTCKMDRATGLLLWLHVTNGRSGYRSARVP